MRRFWKNPYIPYPKDLKVPENFVYSSDKNSEWMTKNELKKWIHSNKNLVGKI